MAATTAPEAGCAAAKFCAGRRRRKAGTATAGGEGLPAGQDHGRHERSAWLQIGQIDTRFLVSVVHQALGRNSMCR